MNERQTERSLVRRKFKRCDDDARTPLTACMSTPCNSSAACMYEYFESSASAIGKFQELNVDVNLLSGAKSVLGILEARILRLDAGGKEK